MLELPRCAVLHAVLHRRERKLTIVGMQHRDIGVEAAVECARREAEERFEPRVPGDVTAREIVRMALGAADTSAGIHFDGVRATGWLGALLERLTNKNAIEPLPTPPGFTGSLRPYQEKGYAWLEQEVAAGRMRTGQRLGTAGRSVGRGFISDGPFGESREIIGGYWFILARDLDEAQAIIARNPCIQLGLFFELRPIESARASAFALTNETPPGRPATG